MLMDDMITTFLISYYTNRLMTKDENTLHAITQLAGFFTIIRAIDLISYSIDKINNFLRG